MGAGFFLPEGEEVFELHNYALVFAAYDDSRGIDPGGREDNCPSKANIGETNIVCPPPPQ